MKSSKIGIEMSTLKVLKEYLIDEYLLNDGNNGKTVMLSGAWGSGKTHFWKNEIELDLSKKLKEGKKACVYISLYGKDSLAELKKEVYFRASTEKDYLSDDIEAFGFDALSTIDDVGGAIGAACKLISSANESRRDQKGIDKLKQGGLVCFDDFERKSKNIDLNDLFGFMSQLAINLNCKVVIILNSDVFEGEEANVFKTVKEKTVNKFFYFEPSVEELFESIYTSDDKYKRLDENKSEILSAIKETEELNARIYMQVLDNCLEWLEKGCDSKFLNVLTLTTINFMLNHSILDYVNIDIEALQHKPEFQGDIDYNYRYGIFFSNLDAVDKILVNYINSISILEDTYMDHEEHSIETRFTDKLGYLKCIKEIKDEDFFNRFEAKLSNDKSLQGDMLLYYHKYKDKNKKYLCQLWKYGYQLHMFNDIDKLMYNKIATFIKTGILIRQNREISS